MQHSPVLELQDLARAGDVLTSSILLQAKLIADKLELVEFSKWIENEYLGYPDKESTPAYRVIGAPIKIRVQDDKMSRFDFDNIIGKAAKNETERKIADKLKKLHIQNSISEIEEMVKKDEDLYFKFPEKIIDLLISATNIKSDFDIIWICPSRSLLSIIANVRMKILDWSIKLEKEGILGEGLRFTSNEKKAASMTIHNITNIHGNVNNAGVIGSGNGDITQNNSITAGDFNSLEKQLKEWGVSDEDVRTLHQAVQESPAPTSADNFGSRIGEWLGNTIGKAYAGTLRIAGSAAPVLLTNAICHYYGIPV